MIDNQFSIPFHTYSIDDWETNKKKILDIFQNHYDKPKIWFNRWRIFFLSCEAFFALNNGKEYFVSHYLLKKKSSRE